MGQKPNIPDDLETYLKDLKAKGLPENFCPIPFTSLILHPTGNVGSCREKGTQHSVGHIKKQSIEEIWNGDTLKSWRREFLTGDIKTCKSEIQNASCHRLRLNRNLFYYMTEFKEQVEGPILRLSPDLNGKCNLKCPFCFVWKMPNGLYDEIPGFWEYMQKNVFPFVIQVDPLGGEPFVQDDLYKSIDMISEVNPEAYWTFTTNGHWKFTDEIRRKLDKIDIDTISFSIDSIDKDNYKKVRTGDLDVVLKNLDDIINYQESRKLRGRGFMILLNATFHQDNWHEVESILKYAIKREVLPFIQFVFEPKKMSLLSLPLNKKKEILLHYLNNLSSHELFLSHRVIRPLLNEMPPKVKEKLTGLYQQLTKNNFPVNPLESYQESHSVNLRQTNENA
jgi:cyclic pyranopterin phosphate synthase